MKKYVRLYSLILSMMVAAAPSAYAQSEGTFAVGTTINRRQPTVGATHGVTDVGLLWRFGHSRTGWGWTYGLGWFSTDINQSIGGRDEEFGEIKIRPFMGGYGYTRVVGRTAVSATALAGYAINSFQVTPIGEDAYRDRLNARSVSADISNAFVVRPEVAAWVDLTRKIGLRVSAGYTIARPKLTISSSLGDDVRRLRADVFTAKIGAVYSIF